MGQLSGLPSLERRSQPDDDELATDDSAELEVNLGLILNFIVSLFELTMIDFYTIVSYMVS